MIHASKVINVGCYFSMGPTYNKRNCNKRKRYFKIFTYYSNIYLGKVRLGFRVLVLF